MREIEKIRDKAFQDGRCTCYCGNTHEFYGGLGYTTVENIAYSDGNWTGLYRHTVKCNKCGKEHTLQF